MSPTILAFKNHIQIKVATNGVESVTTNNNYKSRHACTRVVAMSPLTAARRLDRSFPLLLLSDRFVAFRLLCDCVKSANKLNLKTLKHVIRLDFGTGIVNMCGCG